jgi:hypothetical protein
VKVSQTKNRATPYDLAVLTLKCIFEGDESKVMKRYLYIVCIVALFKQLKCQSRPGVVVHAYNSSCAGGRDGKDNGPTPAWAKS